MAKWRIPNNIGGALGNFNHQGLSNLLSLAVCGLGCEADECDDCPGVAVLGHLENQIGQDGIRFMRDLIDKWRK